MSDATFVAFVPQAQREKLRNVLLEGDTGALRWVEKKRRRGSEFYFSGPPGLARRTHAYVQEWVCAGK